jgi:hypothetical protein
MGVGGTGLFGTWIAASLAVLGAGETFTSSTTAQSLSSSSPASAVGRALANLVYAVVPYPLRMFPEEIAGALQLQQSSTVGLLRDYFLCACGGNVFLSMGCVGGVIVLCLLIGDLRRLAAGDRAAAWFWAVFVVGSSLVGIAAHPTIVLSGGAWNVCGQSLTYIGLAYLAARFSTLRVYWRVLALAGCALDFTLGIFAQARLDNLTVRFGDTVNGMVQVLSSGGVDTLSPWALSNAWFKAKGQVDYVGDFFAPLTNLLLWWVILAFGLIMTRLVMVSFDWGRRAKSVRLPG